MKVQATLQPAPFSKRQRIAVTDNEMIQYPNHFWGMGFVSDALFDGRRLRLLTVIDLYTRE